MTVNTKSIHGRRKLHFESLDDISRELDFLEGKRLKVIGNWSVGQILKHLAIVMNGAIDGLSFPVPWYIRWMAKLFRKQFLHSPMPSGIQLPEVAASALVPGEVSDAEGFSVIRAAIQRLKMETHREPSPVLGKLSIEEHNLLQCRHCELHLGFIIPEE